MSSLQEKNVREVYEAIADHFSDTRYKQWPVVASFLKEVLIDGQALGVDLGAGNGKNVVDSTRIIAVDSCTRLSQICYKQGERQVIVGDVTSVPFRCVLFDFAISIAVIHHLDSEDGRLRALREMARVLVPGGRFLIFVWAELAKNASVRRHPYRSLESSPGDYLIPWQQAGSSDVHWRYYHLFDEGELDALVSKVGLTIDVSGYDRDNYYVVGRCPQ